ncbi:NAD-binding protein [Sanghuangporus baumii]|uniref:NAD-binding protein n=1 Tax=Sanghuangporus baumii TaxID=108892 RepID=A0A9Q5I625_SANBA|nr:NAD-binding protein [Sanghuangporus baumii]
MGKFDPIRDVQDLTGKVAIVTGATSGIGYTTTQQLLRKGATVYLAARNEEKAKSCIERLKAEGLGPGNGKPVFHRLSLDDPRDAKASAEGFLKREERLDILVNNAATFLTPYKLGKLGCENDTVVNQISPFVFSNVLLPLMKKTALHPSADVRIVIVASDTYKFIKDINLTSKEDLNVSYEGERFESMKRYARTKLLNILWQRELSRRLKLSTEDGGSNIIVISLYPGGVYTEGVQETFPGIFSGIFKKLVAVFIRFAAMTPTEGAYNSTFAAASLKVRQEKEKYNGAYLVPGQKIAKLSGPALNEQLAKDLWELQERILEDEGI